MKVALVHDTLINRGGAERVFGFFIEAFPNANIYTSVYLPEETYPLFSNYKIYTTGLQSFIKSEKQFKLLFPLSLLSMKSLIFDDVDVVLSSSTFCAKYVTVLPPAIHICYCYTPFRFIWYPESYLSKNSSLIKKKGLITFSKLFKGWDFKSAQKVNYFISMTSETQRRIKSVYEKDSKIIKPPIDCSKFDISQDIDDFFLVVSRLEEYKKVDIVIKAFNQLGLNLKIVGDGTQKENLKSIAQNNIEFLGKVSSKVLKELYSKCQAVIFPQKEDYGLVPLEANASGRPVIAYGEGGILETSIPYIKNDMNCKPTALFFYEQKPEAIIEAIKIFELIDFDSNYLRKHALKFDKSIFIDNIRNYVSQKYQESL